MSHPHSPQRQPTPDETQRYAKVLHNTALIALVACPTLALLPPRKLDVYTFGLGGATLFSANFLIRERTGRSIWQHLSTTQDEYFAHTPLQHSNISATEQANLNRELVHSAQELRRVQNEKNASVTEQVENQREAWKVQREKEIKEDVEEGKGFGDMIMDQIWEVWNWGKPKEDEDDG